MKSAVQKGDATTNMAVPLYITPFYFWPLSLFSGNGPNSNLMAVWRNAESLVL